MAIPNVKCTKVKGLGYEQCPRDWHRADPELVRATAGTLMGTLIRIVAGYTAPDDFSRTRKSCQIYRDLELGWAHAATTDESTLGRQIIVGMASEHPQTAARVWGAGFAQQLAQRPYVDQFSQQFIGKMALPQSQEAQAFVNGWNLISQTAEGQDVYTRLYWTSYIKPAISKMQEKGWSQKRTLAAAVRLRNSSTSWMNKLFNHPGPEAKAVEEVLSAYVGDKSHRADDKERIMTWPELAGIVDKWPAPGDVRWRTTVQIPASTSGATAGSSSAMEASGTGILPSPSPYPGIGTGTGTGTGANGQAATKKKAIWPWVVAAIVVLGGGTVVTTGAAYLLLRKKKKKKRRKRR